MQFRTLYPEYGDQQHTTLQKILQVVRESGAAPLIPHSDVHVLSSVPIDIANWPAIQTVDGVVTAVQGGNWNVGVSGPVEVTIPQVDLFDRVQTADPVTLFQSKLDLANRTDLWNSTGTATYDSSRARCVLSVANLASATSARQTKRRFIYQPGKTQLMVMTFRMGVAATGITRRLGMFDANNGIYLEQTSAGLAMSIRSGGALSETKAQAAWNKDPLDGTGPSGVTLNMAKTQIFFIALEWLGVGTVQCGFFYNGKKIVAHEFHHANLSTEVYMVTPNLPIRYEITNDGSGAAHDLDQICATVISIGGVQLTGHLHSVDRAATALTTLNDADLYPLLAIRLSDVRANVILDNATVICTSNTALWRWALLLNPTVAGAALSFSAASDMVEAARPSNSSKVTGGILIDSGYALNTASIRPISGFSQSGDNIIGEQTIGGAADILVLAVQRLTGSTEAFYGSLTYREQI